MPRSAALLDAGQPDGDEPAGPRSGSGCGPPGRTLISTVGGAAGPLYGTALMRAGGAVAESAPDGGAGPVLVAALDAAIGGIQQLGKATTGEKTMLDALVAGRRRRAGRARRQRDAAEVAARDGRGRGGRRLATIPLLATKGRASYLGERSVGHQDPGATSAALLLRALADATAGAARPRPGSDAG